MSAALFIALGALAVSLLACGVLLVMLLAPDRFVRYGDAVKLQRLGDGQPFRIRSADERDPADRAPGVMVIAPPPTSYDTVGFLGRDVMRRYDGSAPLGVSVADTSSPRSDGTKRSK